MRGNSCACGGTAACIGECHPIKETSDENVLASEKHVSHDFTFSNFTDFSKMKTLMHATAAAWILLLQVIRIDAFVNPVASRRFLGPKADLIASQVGRVDGLFALKVEASRSSRHASPNDQKAPPMIAKPATTGKDVHSHLITKSGVAERHADSRKKWGIDKDCDEEYWFNEKIHTLGNTGFMGAVHAAMAPLATKMIDALAYDGVDIRNLVRTRSWVCDE